jgi:ligand-binding sensor domain-containing protein
LQFNAGRENGKGDCSMKKPSISLIGAMVLFSIVFRSNADQWVKTSCPWPYNLPVAAFAEMGPKLFAGTGAGGVLLLNNDGMSWDTVNRGLKGRSVSSLAVSERNLFAGTTDGGVSISKDSSMTWAAVKSDGAITSLGVNGRELFAGCWGVWLSTNSGTTWAPADSDLPSFTCPPNPGGFPPGTCNPLFRCFVVRNGDLFAGTSGGVFQWADSAKAWAEMNWNLTSPVSAFVVMGGKIFAGAATGLYYNNEGSILWFSPGSQMSSTGISSLIVYGACLFAGTNLGVFMSRDSGATWTNESSGLPAGSTISALVAHGPDLFAGTTSNGIWRTALSGLSITPGCPGISFTGLHTANLRVTINKTDRNIAMSLTLRNAEQVSLCLYSLSGNKMATIVDAFFGQGLHTIQWNYRQLHSGCYFVKMQTNTLGDAEEVQLIQ